MKNFSKYFPLVLTLIGALAPVFSGPVEDFYGHHAAAVGIVAGIWSTFKWLLPSPLQGK